MRQQDLQYFLEVCENLSLTRAAERIRISQPSLSASMKRLEKEVGDEMDALENRRQCAKLKYTAIPPWFSCASE